MRSEPGDVHALRTESGPTCQALTNQVKGGLISPRGGGGGGGSLVTLTRAVSMEWWD